MPQQLIQAALRRITLITAATVALTAGGLVTGTTMAEAATRTPAPASATPATTATGTTRTAGTAQPTTAAGATRTGRASRTAESTGAAGTTEETPIAGTAQATATAAQRRSLRIVAAAGAQRGKPYRFGAQGPSAFDCSGLTGYAYRSQHISLPRTADAQYRAARRISRADARPGDLVFWVSGGHAYHAAIYAGNGKVWHAPKPGRSVTLASIWCWDEISFGRVGA